TTNVPTVLANPSQASNTFFLTPEVLAWLERNATSHQELVTQLREKINAERFAVAKLARVYLDGLVAAAESRGLTSDAVIKSWREASQKLSEDEPSEFVAQIFGLARSVLQLEQPLALAARHAAIVVGPECKSSSFIEPKTGVFDVCFGEAGKEM